MVDDSALDSHPDAGAELSRRGLFGILAAIGLTGTAAVDFLASAGAARATGYEYIYPSAARTIASPPPDQTGGTFANHVAHGSSAPGVDYSGNGTGYGSAIVAVKGGTVTYAKSDSSGTYGRQVHISHGDGSTTKYMHLNAIAAAATVGTYVTQGTQIGQMGGSAAGKDRAYDPHIHICLQIGSTYTDFADYVEKNLATEGEDMKPIFFSYSGATTTLSNGFVLTAGTLWVRERPTAPLTFVAPLQVQDYFGLYGIDATSPQFKYKDLAWFQAAFANDALQISKTTAAHA